MIAASPETIEGVPDCEAMKMTGENRTAPFASMKPLLDNALALILLLISSPIVLLALILVRLTSRGPALFSQKRLGHAGRTITIYKIRTCTRTASGILVPSGPCPVIAGSLGWAGFCTAPLGRASATGQRPSGRDESNRSPSGASRNRRPAPTRTARLFPPPSGSSRPHRACPGAPAPRYGSR